jgi:hypothetical protein
VRFVDSSFFDLIEREVVKEIPLKGDFRISQWFADYWFEFLFIVKRFDWRSKACLFRLFSPSEHLFSFDPNLLDLLIELLIKSTVLQA